MPPSLLFSQPDEILSEPHREQLKKAKGALAGVVQWTERQPVNQKFAAGSISSRVTCLGFGQVPSWGV